MDAGPGDAARHRLSLALPGAGLLDRGALPPSGTLFILLTLASVSFDGLSKTFWWLGLNGINPLEFPERSAVLGINSMGLVLTWLVLAVLYTGAVLLGWQLAGRPGEPRALLGTLALSIMPIALAFQLSHYLTALWSTLSMPWPPPATRSAPAAMSSRSAISMSPRRS